MGLSITHDVALKLNKAITQAYIRSRYEIVNATHFNFCNTDHVFCHKYIFFFKV